MDRLTYGKQAKATKSVRTPVVQGTRATCSHPLFDASVRPATVLDPFGGSGTVAIVAERLGRDSILIDRNRSYLDMAEFRLAAEKRASA